jgi:hypothetical protein
MSWSKRVYDAVSALLLIHGWIALGKSSLNLVKIAKKIS